MDDIESKIAFKNFISKIIFVVFVIILIALLMSIWLGFSFFGIPLLLIGIIFTSYGSRNRKGRFVSEEIKYEPYEKYHDVYGTRPSTTHSKNLIWWLKNSDPVDKYGRERIILFSGLISFILSLPFICNLMYS